MRPIPYPLREPWAITDAGREKVLGVWEAAVTMGRTDRLLAAIEARDGKPLDNRHEITIDRGVALIPIEGPLFRKAESLAAISGATSYEWIKRQLAAVPGKAQAAVLVFNTPGGEAAGMLACADEIRKLADAMPVEAYVETQASSAGWALAAQCTRITAHRSAYVGSLGVKRMLTDTAEAEAKAGIKNEEIVSEGSEDKRTVPVDDGVRARAQRSVDDLMTEFTASVADGRGVTPEVVLADYGKGDELIATRALAVGMIDEIGDLESVIARLGNGSAPTATAPAAPSGNATGANAMARPPVAAARAEAENPEKKKEEESRAEAEPEMVKCQKCGGSGKNADGAECKHCEGTGEMEKEASADADGDNDGDEEKHEGKAALAALSGLKHSASLAAHAAAIDAKMIPRAAMTAIEARVAAVEADRKAEKKAAEDARLAALADRAEAMGYTAGLDATAAKTKRERFIKIARNEPDAAEEIIASLPGARVSGRLTSQGRHVSGKQSDRPKIDAFGTEGRGKTVTRGDVDIVEIGSGDLMARAKTHMKEHGGTIEEAMVAVVRADPALMQ